MRYFIAKYPVTAETIIPIAKMPSSKLSEPITFLASSRAAPAMAGVPSKKENRAASSLFSLLVRPATIVIPDLETPGISATA